MFLVSFAFRLFLGTFKVVALVFCGLLFADYANQKIADAKENLSNLSWDEIQPKVEQFGESAYARAKVESVKLINSFTEKGSVLKRRAEKRAEVTRSSYRF